MMNKFLRLTTSSQALFCSRRSTVALLTQAAAQQRLAFVTMRQFHAGHSHNHDHDDGKESHSDFKAKAKPTTPKTEE